MVATLDLEFKNKHDLFRGEKKKTLNNNCFWFDESTAPRTHHTHTPPTSASITLKLFVRRLTPRAFNVICIENTKSVELNEQNKFISFTCQLDVDDTINRLCGLMIIVDRRSHCAFASSVMKTFQYRRNSVCSYFINHKLWSLPKNAISTSILNWLERLMNTPLRHRSFEREEHKR